MHSAAVFPVSFASTIIGVLVDVEHCAVRQADERVLRTMQRHRQPARPVPDAQARWRRTCAASAWRWRNSADMIVLVDRATMRFVDVNDTACKLLGYTREEMLAMGPEASCR